MSFVICHVPRRDCSFHMLLILLLLAQACKQTDKTDRGTEIDPYEISQKREVNKDANTIGHGYEFENNGKTTKADSQLYLYEYQEITENIILNSKDIINACKTNKEYLNRRKSSSTKSYGNLEISITMLQEVTTILNTINYNEEPSLSSLFTFYRIEGEDKKGNVHFTSYYIPVIKVRDTKDNVYKFPLYKKPTKWNGKLPPREIIENKGVFDDLNLVLAYSSDLLANYMMQVQGSGYIQYPDGTTQLLSYGGQNGHAYSSLGQHLVKQGHIDKKDVSMSQIKTYFRNNPDSLESMLWNNRSYTFFTKGPDRPVGAANVPLTPFHSIAVDKKFIPLGAVLLGKAPVLNAKGELIKHEYRLLFAQDVGGAIKGPGHVDLYAGTGKIGAQKANAMHHYGELWLLTPKE